MRPYRTLLAFILAGTAHLPARAVQVSLQVTNAHCGLPNGSVRAVVSGGIPPYSYQWSTGAITTVISGLLPGSYTVTVTDGQGATAQASGDVVDIPQLASPYVQLQRADCASSCSAIVSWYEGDLLGTAPYTYSVAPPYLQSGSAVATWYGLCEGSPGLTVTDANGCAGTVEAQVWSTSFYAPTIGQVIPTCGARDVGSFIIEPGWDSEAWFVISRPDGDQDTLAFTHGPFLLDSLAGGSYSVSLYDPNLEFGGFPYCTMPAYVNVPVIPEPCGTVTGKVFNDVDQDCTQDPEDIGLAYRVLTIVPGPIHAITDATGRYRATLGFGDYTLAQPLAEEAQVCPSSHPVPFTVDLTDLDAVVDLADSSLAPHNVRIHVWCSQLRPGFPYHVWGYVQNTSAYPSGALSVDLQYDQVLGNVLVAPGPISVSTGAVHWELTALPAFGQVRLDLYGTVPADVGLLGSQVTFAALVTNANTELELSDNSTALPLTIVGSYDPNDKLAVTDNGNTLAYMIEDDHEVRYTIRFQNTGTAAAVNVVVRDTIEADLDITTLKVLGASHAFTPSIPSGRVLQFAFNGIDLPDSSADERASHGFISFSLKPRADIAVGDVLENTAGIYFDLNPPIITNTSALPVEMSTGVLKGADTMVLLRPNPASDQVVVTIPGAVPLPGTLQVLGSDGRRVHVPMHTQGNGAVLDVRALSAGAYVLRYTGTSGTRTARFVKQ